MDRRRAPYAHGPAPPFTNAYNPAASGLQTHGMTTSMPTTISPAQLMHNTAMPQHMQPPHSVTGTPRLPSYGGQMSFQAMSAAPPATISPSHSQNGNNMSLQPQAQRQQQPRTSNTGTARTGIDYLTAEDKSKFWNYNRNWSHTGINYTGKAIDLWATCPHLQPMIRAAMENFGQQKAKAMFVAHKQQQAAASARQNAGLGINAQQHLATQTPYQIATTMQNAGHTRQATMPPHVIHSAKQPHAQMGTPTGMRNTTAQVYSSSGQTQRANLTMTPRVDSYRPSPATSSFTPSAPHMAPPPSVKSRSVPQLRAGTKLFTCATCMRTGTVPLSYADQNCPSCENELTGIFGLGNGYTHTVPSGTQANPVDFTADDEPARGAATVLQSYHGIPPAQMPTSSPSMATLPVPARMVQIGAYPPQAQTGALPPNPYTAKFSPNITSQLTTPTATAMMPQQRKRTASTAGFEPNNDQAKKSKSKQPSVSRRPATQQTTPLSSSPAMEMAPMACTECYAVDHWTWDCAEHKKAAEELHQHLGSDSNSSSKRTEKQLAGKWMNNIFCFDCTTTGCEKNVSVNFDRGNNGVHCEKCCDMLKRQNHCIWHDAFNYLGVDDLRLPAMMQTIVENRARACRQRIDMNADCECKGSLRYVQSPAVAVTAAQASSGMMQTQALDDSPESRHRANMEYLRQSLLEPDTDVPPLSDSPAPSPPNALEALTPPEGAHLPQIYSLNRPSPASRGLKRKLSFTSANVIDLEDEEPAAKRTNTAIANASIPTVPSPAKPQRKVSFAQPAPKPQHSRKAGPKQTKDLPGMDALTGYPEGSRLTADGTIFGPTVRDPKDNQYGYAPVLAVKQYVPYELRPQTPPAPPLPSADADINDILSAYLAPTFKEARKRNPYGFNDKAMNWEAFGPHRYDWSGLNCNACDALKGIKDQKVVERIHLALVEDVKKEEAVVKDYKEWEAKEKQREEER